ncbi:MAG: hypothetical protein Q7J34_08595 [Bacteroidales bacterium]|nr:hypothetical protein [Bacteroidales bacterium]
MEKLKICFVILLIATMASSCSWFDSKLRPNERILARANKDYLYESAITDLVPPGTPTADSTAMVKSFIENWIRDRLIINEAEKNLADDKKDFSKQLENYRNSLLTYSFENDIINKNLDTLITESEIENYYEQNKDNFILKDNIVRAAYVKILKDSIKAIRTARKYLEADTILSYDRFEKFCLNRTQGYLISYTSWYLFRDLMNQVPIVTYNEEAFLKNSKLVEQESDIFLYIIRFYNFKVRDAVSPLAFERQNIRGILLNLRKVQLIKKHREDIFTKALKNKNFEIY